MIVTSKKFENPLPPLVKTIQFQEFGSNTLHFAALPDGNFTLDPPEFPKDPFFTYPFQLDPFQICAISCVHRKESVLVSAHTSAGKTAIALYAISMALKTNSRVVYTSPIKALSNQKFKELKDNFSEVGLMTGDTEIDRSSPCLVMTTEILRKMLFEGDPLIHEISWVIFDECHYMKDPDRGVVWEESIILLPSCIRFVFLSATIPNAKEFSEWVSQLHNQICHVIYTEYRPVPLKFYISPLGNQEIILASDGTLRENVFSSLGVKVKPVVSQFHGASVYSVHGSKKISKREQRMHTANLVCKLDESNLSPMIVFAFSRKECSNLSEQFGAKKFVKPEESYSIKTIFQNAIYSMESEDQQLPQVKWMQDLVERGIGVHHGGLLPRMKEIVEILFGIGLIKVLFATETFSMGLNMPARTVIFNSLEKFDGNENRLISSGEFIQMSGRAGRRNHDTFGAVVLIYTGSIQTKNIKDMMTNSAQPLNSEFRVTYGMLLNLLRAENFDPMVIMKKSFHQFQIQKELPEIQEKIAKIDHQIQNLLIVDEEKLLKYLNLEEKKNQIENEMRCVALKTDNILKLLNIGKLVLLKEWGWCVVVSQPTILNNGEMIVLAGGKEAFDHSIQPDSSKMSCPYLIKQYISNILKLSETTLNVDFSRINDTLMTQVLKAIRDLEKNGIPINEPHNYVTVEKDLYFELMRKVNAVQQDIFSIGEFDQEMLRMLIRKRELLNEKDMFEQKKSSLQYLNQQKDLDAMKQVLKKKNYLSEDGVVTTAGRAASLVSAADELVVTDFILQTDFSKLSNSEVAAIFSVFVCQENDSQRNLPDSLKPFWSSIQKIIHSVSTCAIECGCQIDQDKFSESFSPLYCQLTKSWAEGVSFNSLMELNPSFQEGSVIRVIKRLNELLLQVSTIYSFFGNLNMKGRFISISKLIERGIISLPSLYY